MAVMDRSRSMVIAPNIGFRYRTDEGTEVNCLHIFPRKYDYFTKYEKRIKFPKTKYF
jgi:hypothetical protein